MKRSGVVALIWLLSFIPFNSAQTAVSGTLRGLVHDQSGAVVRNAKLSLVSQASGQQLERVTSGNRADDDDPCDVFFAHILFGLHLRQCRLIEPVSVTPADLRT